MRLLVAVVTLSGCANSTPAEDQPRIERVSPATWRSGEDTAVRVLGDGFFAKLQLNLDWPDRSIADGDFAIELRGDDREPIALSSVTRKSTRELTGVVPAVDVGTYSVIVTDPRGHTAKLANAVEVVATGGDAGPDGGPDGDAGPDGGPDGDAGPDGDGGSDNRAPADGGDPFPPLRSVYTDDFSDDDGRYEHGSATWSLGPDYLTHTDECATGPFFTLLTTETWSAPIVVSVAIRFESICPDDTESNQLALLVLASGAPYSCGDLYAYACVVSFDRFELIGGKLDGECGSDTPSVSATIPDMTLGTTYRLKGELWGDLFTCTLSEGDLAAPVSCDWLDETGTTFTSGSLGFGAAWAIGHFDDLEVWAP